MSILERARGRWLRLPEALRDLVPGLLLLVAAFTPALQVYGSQLGDLPPRPLDLLAVLAAALECLPLALRRRWPLVSLVLVSTGFAVDQLLSYHLVSGAAITIALLSTGIHLDRRRRWTAAGLAVSYLALVLALIARGSAEGTTGFLTFFLLMVLFWVTGSRLRSHRLAEEERVRREAEQARAQERARLARELHDVVSHHVTAMVVQAQAARWLVTAPEALEESLAAIADTGRLASADLRTLLQVLGASGPGVRTTLPTVADIPELVEQARRAGQPVDLDLPGSAGRIPEAASLTAYRVVQESLTNALKHAAGSPTAVSIRAREEEVDVRITTEGMRTARASDRPAAGPGLVGSGRGLIGLRERVEALGGRCEAGPLPDGGFAVHALIPTTRIPTTDIAPPA
ncbi:sensor histidine kinase [Brachybacterium sp. DNPG3]